MNHTNFSGLKILITGGAGFIGSNLCDYFIKNKAKVVCLDNFSTGNFNNISKLIDNSNFKLIEGDICDLKTCNKASPGVDFILHQAALGSVPRSIKDPISTNNVNISGFLNMLISSKDNNVTRFVYAASSSTYGDSTELPKVEENIGKPLSPYAITKYVNELYAEVFNKNYKTDTIGLRYFNVFGKRQDPNGAYAAVIPKFISKLIKHESPIINGDGSFSRDFTYVENVIQMNVLSILSKNEKAINKVYNVAFGEQTSLNELTKLLKKLLGEYDKEIINIKNNYGPNRKGDIPHSLASIQKAKKYLKYKPEYDLESGLKKSIKWYWDNLK